MLPLEIKEMMRTGTDKEKTKLQEGNTHCFLKQRYRIEKQLLTSIAFQSRKTTCVTRKIRVYSNFMVPAVQTFTSMVSPQPYILIQSMVK